MTGQIIDCAIEVHRALGAGLREKTYDEALAIEMLDRRMAFERQVRIPVHYKAHLVGEYGLDFIVNKAVVVEVKAVERFEPVFEAQILGYLRASGLRLGLLLNFNSRLGTVSAAYILATSPGIPGPWRRKLPGGLCASVAKRELPTVALCLPWRRGLLYGPVPP